MSTFGHFYDKKIQVEYVETLMAVDAFQSLRGDQGVKIAAVDSASASLFLTKAYNEKERLKLVSKLTRIETEHAIHERWTRQAEEYAEALGKLRDLRVTK